MDSFLAYVHMLGIAVLVGKVVLLSFVVAPVLARTLDPEHFGTVVRRLFPAYYLVGIAAAAVGLTVVGAMGIIRGVSQTIVVSAGLWCVVLASEAYCRIWLTPQSNVKRDRLKEQQEFSRSGVEGFMESFAPTIRFSQYGCPYRGLDPARIGTPTITVGRHCYA